MAKHSHFCDSCGDVIYTCDEVVLRDDCGAWCGNAPVGGKEYCENCCVETPDEDEDDDIATIEPVAGVSR